MLIRTIEICLLIASMAGCQSGTCGLGHRSKDGSRASNHDPRPVSYRFSEAEVDRIRAVIASIRYPQEIGYTLQALDLDEDISPNYVLYADSFPLTRPAITNRTIMRYAISPCEDLVVVEHYTVYDDREVERREVSADVRCRRD